MILWGTKPAFQGYKPGWGSDHCFLLTCLSPQLSLPVFLLGSLFLSFSSALSSCLSPPLSLPVFLLRSLFLFSPILFLPFFLLRSLFLSLFPPTLFDPYCGFTCLLFHYLFLSLFLLFFPASPSALSFCALLVSLFLLPLPVSLHISMSHRFSCTVSLSPHYFCIFGCSLFLPICPLILFVLSVRSYFLSLSPISL